MSTALRRARTAPEPAIGASRDAPAAAIDRARGRARAGASSLPALFVVAAAAPVLLVGVTSAWLAAAAVNRDAAGAWLPSAVLGLTFFAALGAASGVAFAARRIAAPIGDVADGLRRSEETDVGADDGSARGLLLEKLINAQEEERKRIARELHDGVGQALLSMLVGLKLIARLDDIEAARAKADDVREVAAETLEQVRMLSRELRPSVLDDLGLAVALDRYAAEFTGRHPAISVDVHCDVSDRLPSVVETALYRIVQEAMTNAARHSQCTTIGVLLSRRDNRVQAIIEDNGRGFDVVAARRARSSVGIHGMAERAELIGGAMEIESGEDGTAVYVEVLL